MSTFLHKHLTVGVLKSRRLGNSFGINLSPTTRKICNFNCVYCECGNNTCDYSEKEKDSNNFCSIEQFSNELEKSLQEHKEKQIAIDSITFSGNGEATLHPYFSEIIDETIKLRNIIFPNVKISVLTNSTRLNNKKIVTALQKIDNPILKIDTVSEDLFNKINLGKIHGEDITASQLKICDIINNIKNNFENPIIQTMLLRSNFPDNNFDNSSEEEIKKYISQMENINPKFIMLYSIDRDTAISGLVKLTYAEIEKIALQLRGKNIKTDIY